ncbi:type II toxin-antitoxin system VapC family toxin [Thauera sp. SDU_THAU2]|uniref:type II toxin-antitoxin system VapC family toxin n=1 Tax=Thauera sp. SDU_THAU2 TaxID=3136633 RepID=UPI00311D8031
MKLLLDTHILLWAAADSSQLGNKARKLLLSGNTQLFFSSASIWEVAIKQGLGRADFQVDPRLLRRGLLNNGYTELPVTGEHAVETNALPDLHKDPFDRILIAQANVEGMKLVTADHRVAQYPGKILKV